MAGTFARPLRRVTLLLSSAALVALLPIVLTASPAAAVTFSCNHFTSGGVTFSVCIGKAGTGTAEAEITGISGTHVSGNLAIDKNGSQVADNCSGQFFPGDHCAYTHNSGSGRYEAIWRSAGSGNFPSPTITV